MKKRERRERGKKGKAEKKRGGKGKRNRQLRAVMDSGPLALLYFDVILLDGSRAAQKEEGVKEKKKGRGSC